MGPYLFDRIRQFAAIVTTRVFDRAAADLTFDRVA